MSGPRGYRTQTGQQIALDREIGKGGEGLVYTVKGDPNIVAKIYHHDKALARRSKIEAIVSEQWSKATSAVAFPVDALFGLSGNFAGFTMPFVGKTRPIHNLYSPTSRKTSFPNANFRFLIRTSLNIAKAFANVHAIGCVIGDVNHSGVLISGNAMATLIDCDSFQVTALGKCFPCTVGVPDFTPPELQGKRLDQVQRTTNHDAFGLAIIIFNLLFMGRHPFAGRFLGKGDMPLETAIAQYRFAYSVRKNETRMESPPNVPLLSDVPKEMAEAFELAFGQVGTSNRRPTASEWVELLKRSEAEVRGCAANPAHQYFRGASSCPWCRMESAYPGFLAFAAPLTISPTTPVNLGQLIASIRSVPNPGTVGALASMMTPYQGGAASITASVQQGWIKSYGAALFAAALAVVFFQMYAPGPLLGFLALGVTIYLASRRPPAVAAHEKVINQARVAWNNVETQWKRFSDNQKFASTRQEAEHVITAIQGLGAEEIKSLSDLKTRLRETQLNRYLQQFYIEHAKIKGVAGNRKVVLRSYGIETAADVSRWRIEQISGFGPKITGSIVTWRTALERKFDFDPNQPLNPADVAAAKAKIHAREKSLQHDLRRLFGELQRISQETLGGRTSIRNTAQNVWNALKEAEAKNQGLTFGMSMEKRILGIAVVMLCTFFASIQFRSPVTTQSISTPVRQESGGQTAPQIPTISVPSRPNSAGQARPDVRNAPRTQSGDHGMNGVPRDRTDVAPKSSPVTPPYLPPAVDIRPPEPGQPVAPAPPSPVVETKPPEPRPVATPPPLPPVVDIGLLPGPGRGLTEDSTTGSLGSSAMTRENSVRIQTRLRQLGFLASDSVGEWDSVSREAVRSFRVANHLTPTDTWDTDAEDKLRSQNVLRLSQSFIGGWSEGRPCERGSDPEMFITARRAQTNGGSCEFKNVSSDGVGWRVKATCTVGSSSLTLNIKFTVVGKQLTWASERTTTKYYRCE